MIKVESITRPDLMRYASTQPPTTDEWWEWSPLFHTGNAGKRAITLDLTRPEGVDVFERLLGTADVLVENYTPRVMEQFGLGWDRVHEINPDLIMTRMPAFGLDGPWRDNTGFAQTMECVSGMAWLTGFAGRTTRARARRVRSACRDARRHRHACWRSLDRDAHGGGRQVEATMVEAALNAAAEQVLEYSATGTVLHPRRQPIAPGAAPPRRLPRAPVRTAGSRSRSRPTRSGMHCAKCSEQTWATTTDSHTRGRRKAHDLSTRTCSVDDHAQPDAIADELCAAGVPAAEVIPSRDVVHNPQLRTSWAVRDRASSASRASTGCRPCRSGSALSTAGCSGPRRRSASTTTRSSPSSASAPRRSPSSATPDVIGERPTGL